MFMLHCFFMYFLQVCAELKQVQAKLVQVEQSVHTQVAECERQQQKIRELELELARNSTNRSATTSLQEDLQAERARLIAADKRVSADKISHWFFCSLDVAFYWLIIPNSAVSI